MHKNLLDLPGRPIISRNACLTENTSKYIDSILCPFVLYIALYLRDTMHLLQVLEGKFVVDLLHLVLSNKVFCFAGSHYFQVQGVAMGLCCTPS